MISRFSNIAKNAVSNSQLLKKVYKNPHCYLIEKPVAYGMFAGATIGIGTSLVGSFDTEYKTTITNFPQKMCEGVIVTIFYGSVGLCGGCIFGMFWPISLCVFMKKTGELIYNSIKNN